MRRTDAARAPATQPAVVTVAEVGQVLGFLRGTQRLVGLLLSRASCRHGVPRLSDYSVGLSASR
jgi:hypothetical protein